MNFIGIIPARYKSSRFPGKLLIDINGKSMLQRVYEQSEKTKSLSYLAVATDDKRIFEHVKKIGGNVIMTSEKHKTGTDRCLEAAEKLKTKIKFSDDDVIINIQGDEPFIQPEQITQLTKCFKNKNTQIATLIKKIENDKEIYSPGTIKVVFNKDKEAIYFSRSPIPFFRNKEQKEWLGSFDFYKHIGIYSYRFRILKQIVKLKQSSLEIAESLEQLRWLQNGYKIKIEITEHESFSIDTPEDLKKINMLQIIRK
ncbi:MAG: 3-deoxy-manno-octulosonate cytidylyltransferase [Bacteroidales bacterium]|nr:3-deoxy-manno-octulosonate cytidylyltransferase [Bacteroidales bacterium]